MTGLLVHGIEKDKVCAGGGASPKWITSAIEKVAGFPSVTYATVL